MSAFPRKRPRQSPSETATTATATPTVPVSPMLLPADATGTRHVVREGETLASIARHAYGDATRWKLLFDANRHLIGDNPAKLAPGLVLLLPSPD
jgi:5'-nucleotidase